MRSLRFVVRVALTLLASVVTTGCEDDLSAQVISPRYTEPCKYTDCSGHGQCSASDAGVPQCLCDLGYATASCARCDDGFHRDASGRCMPDVACADQLGDPCAPGGTCIDRDGVIACECAEGYAGPRCNLTGGSGGAGGASGVGGASGSGGTSGSGGASGSGASGSSGAGGSGGEACEPGWTGEDCDLCQPSYVMTLDFAATLGFPTDRNTCYAPFGYPGTPDNAYQTTDHTLRSEAGYGAYRLCAPSDYNGFSTQHLELSASSARPAELEFSDPAVTVRFDVGVRLSTLALDIHVGSLQSGALVYRPMSNVTIDLMPQSNVAIALDNLSPPASVIRFVPRDARVQVLGLDNIVSQHGTCAP